MSPATQVNEAAAASNLRLSCLTHFVLFCWPLFPPLSLSLTHTPTHTTFIYFNFFPSLPFRHPISFFKDKGGMTQQPMRKQFTSKEIKEQFFTTNNGFIPTAHFFFFINKLGPSFIFRSSAIYIFLSASQLSIALLLLHLLRRLILLLFLYISLFGSLTFPL